jgi:hypothetical protein
VPSSGTCSTSISWNASNVASASVWVTDSRYPNNAPGNLASGLSGTQVVVPWIQVATYTFILRNGTTSSSPELARTTVTGTSTPTGPALSCTSVAPGAATTSATTGSFRVYAYGVTDATSVTFPTWGDSGGQDDLVWYNGVNAGGGTWYADVNLANHKAGAPEYGTFNTHVYLNNASQTNKYCGAMTWTRTQTSPPSNNLIANGGFESPYTASYIYPAAGGLPNWMISGGVAIQRNGSAWGAPTAPEGAQTVALQSSSSISQTINLNAGQYTLKFKTAPRTNYGGQQTIEVRLNGTAIDTVAPTGTSFTQYQTTLNVANAGNNTIALVGTNSSGDNSAFIDEVLLTSSGTPPASSYTYDEFVPYGQSKMGYFSSPPSGPIVSSLFWKTTPRGANRTDVQWGPPDAMGNSNIEEHSIKSNCANGESFVWLDAYRNDNTNGTSYRFRVDTTKALLIDSTGVKDITNGGSCGANGQPYARYLVTNQPYIIQVWGNIYNANNVFEGRRYFWQARFTLTGNVANSCWQGAGSNSRVTLKQEEVWWDTVSGWTRGTGTLATPTNGPYVEDSSKPEPNGNGLTMQGWQHMGLNAGWLWQGGNTSPTAPEAYCLVNMQ